MGSVVIPGSDHKCQVPRHVLEFVRALFVTNSSEKSPETFHEFPAYVLEHCGPSPANFQGILKTCPISVWNFLPVHIASFPTSFPGTVRNSSANCPERVRFPLGYFGRFGVVFWVSRSFGSTVVTLFWNRFEGPLHISARYVGTGHTRGGGRTGSGSEGALTER